MKDRTTQRSWRQLRRRLTLLYLVVGFTLLVISGIGHARLLSEVGKTFGGFFWAIDADKQVVVVSTPPQLDNFGADPGSLTNSTALVGVNSKPVSALSSVYQQATPDKTTIRYTVEQNGQSRIIDRVASTFTWDMWFSNYGWALIAGICWLLVGGILLATSQDWTGAVEGMTLLPPAMLFLLYSHWGNVQQAYPADLVFQLLWVPAFALLGAGFIHLSLTYRSQASRMPRGPSLWIDGAPYLPLLALLAFDVSMLLIRGSVPTRIEFLLALGYAVLGGLFSLVVGLISLLRIFHVLPGAAAVPEPLRRRLGDLLTLWIGDVGLGFGLGILPILLTGRPLVPLLVFYVLAAAYPLVLLYAIRSLRLIARLEVTLEQREEALREQQKTAAQLRQANRELQEATSLLLHADAHQRSILSQRIHDQPKQQALRIRSLLGHWQHKLKLDTENDAELRSFAQPVIEALGKVRKISEELESDLRGLQLLVEDSYRRRNLGLKLHLETLIRDDLPALHPESPLKIRPDLWAVDDLSHDLEQTPEGEKFAEAISYTVTQALLNIYNHAGATFATVRAARTSGHIEIMITDDGHGFDVNAIPPEKTSLFKARLKAREAGGTLTMFSAPRSQAQHGTTILLRLPLPPSQTVMPKESVGESLVEEL
jgi:signal transduction histidine kinase